MSVPKRKRHRGRPSIYDPALAERLCLAIATSTKGLRAICTKRGFPSRTTVYKWLAANPDFANRYARARESQAQILFDQIIEIADKPKLGAVVKTDSTGRRERRVGDMIEHRRLQIDARKWALAKLLPKRYGDRVEVEDNRQDPLAALIDSMHKLSEKLGPPEQVEGE